MTEIFIFKKGFGYKEDGTPVLISCAECSKLFHYTKYYPNKKTCSMLCNNRFRAKDENYRAKRSAIAKQRVGSLNSNYKGGGIDFTCKLCKKDFKVPRHAIKGKKSSGTFCSADCSLTYRNLLSVSKEQLRLVKLTRKRMNNLLFNRSSSLPDKEVPHVGCSISFLKKHLEKNFKTGMSWNNKHLWHIDHIKPTALFRFKSIQDKEFLECWHYSNLQPLWATENLAKSSEDRKLVKDKYEESYLKNYINTKGCGV